MTTDTTLHQENTGPAPLTPVAPAPDSQSHAEQASPPPDELNKLADLAVRVAGARLALLLSGAGEQSRWLVQRPASPALDSETQAWLLQGLARKTIPEPGLVLGSPRQGPLAHTHCLIVPLRQTPDRSAPLLCAFVPGQTDADTALELLRDLAEPFAATLRLREDLEQQRAATARAERHVRMVEAINRVSRQMTGELDLHSIVQAATDAATEVVGAQFGAFFYNATDEKGEHYTLYTLSGVPREAFSRFPMPRNTAIFAPTFAGKGIMRLDDVTKDPRFGKNPPYNGMPDGHLPVRSYLAVPVLSSTGKVHGGLFFGHSEPGVFCAESELAVVAIAAQAAIAIDNSHLFHHLAEAERRFRNLVNQVDAVFWEADAETFQFVYVSERAETLLGYPADQWLTEPNFWVRILHPDDRHWAPQFCLEQTRHAQDHDFEYRVIAADGREVWLRDLVHVISDIDGRPKRLRGLMLDVTDRKRAERIQSLRQNVTQLLAGNASVPITLRELLRAIGEGSGFDFGALWMCDPESEDGRSLTCADTWHAPALEAEEFERVTRTHRFKLGIGIPGQVLAHNRAIWFHSLDDTACFIRNQAAQEAGFTSGFAFPIRLGERAHGAIEFYSRRRRESEPELLDNVASFGSQIGQFIQRRDAEQALRESEERLRFALDAGRLGSWDWDVETGRVRWSDNLERMHGLKPNDFPGTIQAVIEEMHPEDRERVRESIERALRGVSDYDVEYRIVRPDGDIRWVMGRGRVTRWNDGRPTRMTGVCMDITERKQAETALQFLLEASSVLASSLDYETTLTAVARLAVPRIADWCAVDLVAEDGSIRRLAAEHVDPDKVKLAFELNRDYPPDPNGAVGLPKVIRTGKLEFYPEIDPELFPINSRSEQQWELFQRLGLKSAIVVPLNARGRTLGAITLVTAESGYQFDQNDVSLAEELARRAAVAIDNALLYRHTEEARKQQEHRAEQAALIAEVGVALNQNAPVNQVLRGCVEAIVRHLHVEAAGVWVLAETCEHFELQAMAGTASNLPSQLALDTTAAGATASEAMRPLNGDATPDGLFLRYPLTVVDRTVGMLAVHLAGAPDPDTRDALESIPGIIAQGLERNRIEEELRFLNSYLERRVRQRTQELTEANRELESFSYSVSHDLRAPLRHIAGFADLLSKRSRDNLDETSRRYLQVISDSARRAGELVDDLLSFSRMGRAEFRFGTVDMRQLVDETILEYAPELESRAVRWEIAPLPVITGDSAMLRLVWRNLISNAIKYTRDHPSAEIRIGSVEDPEKIVFFVRDNGVGFDMRYADKLFGVFQRLHKPEDFEGTGIGLANVRRIIQRHGGQTWADSQVGKGATFYFSLPRQEGEKTQCSPART